MNIPIVRMMKDPVTSSFGNVRSLSMNRSASRSEFTRTRHGCTLCGDGAWMAVSRSVVQISGLFAPVLLVMAPLEQQAADASASRCSMQGIRKPPVFREAQRTGAFATDPSDEPRSAAGRSVGLGSRDVTLRELETVVLVEHLPLARRFLEHEGHRHAHLGLVLAH